LPRNDSIVATGQRELATMSFSYHRHSATSINEKVQTLTGFYMRRSEAFQPSPTTTCGVAVVSMITTVIITATPMNEKAAIHALLPGQSECGFQPGWLFGITIITADDTRRGLIDDHKGHLKFGRQFPTQLRDFKQGRGPFLIPLVTFVFLKSKETGDPIQHDTFYGRFMVL
jgi:hypothetical protein